MPIIKSPLNDEIYFLTVRRVSFWDSLPVCWCLVLLTHPLAYQTYRTFDWFCLKQKKYLRDRIFKSSRDRIFKSS